MKDKVLDTRELERIRDYDWKHFANFNEAIEQLRQEGMPTYLAFIEMLTKDENSLKDFINEQQRKRLSGFVPVAEKEFIHQAYTDLHERLEGKIASLRSSLHAGLKIKADGDTTVIDKEAFEAEQERQATIEIDVNKGAEYHAKLLELIKALNEMKKYEKANKFPNIVAELRFGDLTNFSFELGSTGTVSEDLFAYHMRHFLRKK